MLDTRKYVPRALYEYSNDYRALLSLLNLLMNNIKLDTDNFINLINADKCPDHMLPLLASYVGYTYDYRVSVKTNRIIIKNFQYLIRNRGSELGIRLAVALAINASKCYDSLDSTENFSIEYDRSSNKCIIYLYYPRNISKIKELIEVVRPAGMYIDMLKAIPVSNNEQGSISDKVDINKIKYDYIVRDEVDKSPIEFSEVSKGNNDK